MSNMENQDPGMMMCPECQGTGKKKISALEVVNCPMCKGSGKVPAAS